MPPGLMKTHLKKRKASDESEERDGSEEQEQPPPPQAMVRQRRSAAQKCHEVWESIKPGAKMAGYMEEEQKRGQSPSPNTESGGFLFDLIFKLSNGNIGQTQFKTL